jgi:hypothetical protein
MKSGTFKKKWSIKTIKAENIIKISAKAITIQKIFNTKLAIFLGFQNHVYSDFSFSKI